MFSSKEESKCSPEELIAKAKSLRYSSNAGDFAAHNELLKLAAINPESIGKMYPYYWHLVLGLRHSDSKKVNKNGANLRHSLIYKLGQDLVLAIYTRHDEVLEFYASEDEASQDKIKKMLAETHWTKALFFFKICDETLNTPPPSPK